MLNFAAFRYRHVDRTHGGPVARIEICDATFMGKRHFLANAALREELVPDLWKGEVFSHAHGTGVSTSPMIARFMAISEAMERWAHWSLHRESPGRYGFDVDPSSNGMAAYPGLFARQARPSALLEAAERYNVLNWWEGNLAAAESATPWPGVRAVTICSEAPGVTVILFRTNPNGYVAYGHASAWRYSDACRKATLEMERHALVVSQFALARAGRIQHQLSPDAHPIERRSLFFATEAGHELFLARLRSGPRRCATAPRLVYDGSIPGPWSRYADVWRVAYEPPSTRFLSADENYFFW